MVETGPCVKYLSAPLINNFLKEVCEMLETRHLTNVVVLGGWTKELTRYLIKNYRSLDKKHVKRFIEALQRGL